MGVDFFPSREPNILISSFKGTLADQTLADYAHQILHAGHLATHKLELIDGSLITKVTLTSAGSQHLENMIRNNIKLVRNRRVAMLGPSDLVFGMFRMWEMSVDDVGYEIRVFRQRVDAMNWLQISDLSP